MLKRSLDASEGIAVRYYFDIRSDGVAARDHVGRDFDSSSAAIAYARELAEGLRVQNASGQNTRVCVISETGSTVHEQKLLIRLKGAGSISIKTLPGTSRGKLVSPCGIDSLSDE
jgi:hypothetical protein